MCWCLIEFNTVPFLLFQWKRQSTTAPDQAGENIYHNQGPFSQLSVQNKQLTEPLTLLLNSLANANNIYFQAGTLIQKIP